jgi:hypothetical protein
MKSKNHIKEEIKKRIQNANKSCFGMLKYFKFKFIIQETKG